MSQSRRLLLFGLLSCYLSAAFSAIEFLTYGTAAGDLQLTPGNTASFVELAVDTPVEFYGRLFNSVFVSLFACSSTQDANSK